MSDELRQNEEAPKPLEEGNLKGAGVNVPPAAPKPNNPPPGQEPEAREEVQEPAQEQVPAQDQAPEQQQQEPPKVEDKKEPPKPSPVRTGTEGQIPNNGLKSVNDHPWGQTSGVTPTWKSQFKRFSNSKFFLLSLALCLVLFLCGIDFILVFIMSWTSSFYFILHLFLGIVLFRVIMKFREETSYDNSLQ